MVTQEMLDQQGAAIAACQGLAAEMDPDDDLVRQAKDELDAAQAALDEAQIALDQGNEALAAQKLQESLNHTAKALELLQRALGGG